MNAAETPTLSLPRKSGGGDPDGTIAPAGHRSLRDSGGGVPDHERLSTCSATRSAEVLLSMRYRSWALTRHRGGDDRSDLLSHFDKVRIGKVGLRLVPGRTADSPDRRSRSPGDFRAAVPRSGGDREAGRRRSTRGGRGGARLHHGFHRLRLQPVRRGRVAPPAAPRRHVGPARKAGRTDRSGRRAATVVGASGARSAGRRRGLPAALRADSPRDPLGGLPAAARVRRPVCLALQVPGNPRTSALDAMGVGV